VTISGAFAALPTFFDADDAVDAAAIAGHVRRLADTGLDGVLACGSTGEFVALDEDERMAVAEAALEGAAGRIAVAVQVGTSATRQSVRLARHAAAAGADAIACVTPYYLRADDEGLGAHLRAVREAAPALPLLAYSIPRLTGYAYGVETLAALAAEDVVHGVKESSDEMGRLHALRESCGEAFAIFVGSPALQAAALAQGFAGSITGLGAVAPEACAEVQRLGLAGDHGAASALVQRLRPAAAACGLGMPPAGVKAGASLRFGTPPAVRAPRRALGPLELERAAALLAAAGLAAPVATV
jgi:4-hydroxy-tetrahydrodipicolinate synthase